MHSLSSGEADCADLRETRGGSVMGTSKSLKKESKKLEAHGPILVEKIEHNIAPTRRMIAVFQASDSYLRCVTSQ